jgi:hypothetical protein
VWKSYDESHTFIAAREEGLFIAVFYLMATFSSVLFELIAAFEGNVIDFEKRFFISHRQHTLSDIECRIWSGFCNLQIYPYDYLS